MYTQSEIEKATQHELAHIIVNLHFKLKEPSKKIIQGLPPSLHKEVNRNAIYLTSVLIRAINQYNRKSATNAALFTT